MKTYSAKLTASQNAALDKLERLTGLAPFGIEELEDGEITAQQLWKQNLAWLQTMAEQAKLIEFK